MTYERKIDTPHAEAVALSAALHPSEADSLRATIDQSVAAARDAIRHVPARAWRIGAMLAAAAASLAVGTYAAFGRKGPSRKRATTRKTARRGNGSRTRAKAA